MNGVEAQTLAGVSSCPKLLEAIEMIVRDVFRGWNSARAFMYGALKRPDSK